MIQSYIKTSVRNLSRNKLFSAINVVGLAIGMSVGLLLIAFAHDLLSYDRFNVNGSRIYRITSNAKFKGGYEDRFATTSLRAGRLIQEKISGLEEAVILRGEFAGDVRVNDAFSVPLTGFYAEPSMLNIFTMPMVKGNAATALQKPYSVVLTETSEKKLFGDTGGFGKTISVNGFEFEVTGILKDVPFFSHIRFESLVSFSTLETQLQRDEFLKWETVYQRNYVYLMIEENADLSAIQNQLSLICLEENRMNDDAEVQLSLMPLYDIMLGENLTYSISPVMPAVVLWSVGALALVVILSACFNYTNLSIARSLRRFKEVGLRKVIGAGSKQVRQQFLAEAIIVSLAALLVSFGIFLLVRSQFLTIAPDLLNMVRLEVTPVAVLLFITLAVFTGILAGILPAVFFAKVSAMNALRDASSVKLVKGISFRRALVVLQYTVTLIFITGTFIGYKQYKDILAFDLGFKTDNILNIKLQKNKPEALIAQLSQMQKVSGISQSRLLTSVGNVWGAYLKYQNLNDSAVVLTNIVDDKYLPLHQYHFVAGKNFVSRPVTEMAATEVIVNEKTLRQFQIANGDPQHAIGEEILLNGKRLTIVGVIKDFHYLKLDREIQPVAFTYLTPDAYLTSDRRDGIVNVLISSNDPIQTMEEIRQIWKMVDPIHPLDAEFYDNEIKSAYSELAAMIKVIGFLSFIAISIASLGMLGMVVFTTETRLKEISIRKVLGASSVSIVLMLSRVFVLLLGASSLVALPLTFVFFERVVLTRFPFHEPIGIVELLSGLAAVSIVAFSMIGFQTIKAAQRNPAEILKGQY